MQAQAHKAKRGLNFGRASYSDEKHNLKRDYNR